MATELIINATLPETRIALLENNEIQELHIERDSERGIVGNIYKGKVIRVLPGMQAAFVDIGLEKAAFLYVDDIFFPDMKNPLISQPLPDPQTQTARAAQPQGKTGERPEPRGRGGRGGRGPRVDATPKQAPIPGTPEAHAAMQREYAKQMLDLDQEGAVEEPGVVPVQVTPVSAQPESIAAEVNPNDRAFPEEQPEARSPVGAEGAELLEEEEEEDDEDATTYRPEPLIDTAAWEEDLEEVREETLVPEAAGIRVETLVAPVEAIEDEEDDVSPEAEVEEVAAAPEASTEAAPVVGPSGEEVSPAQVAVAPAAPGLPPVKPLATPVVNVPKAQSHAGHGHTTKEKDKDKDSDDDDSEEMPRRRRRREAVNIADLVKEGQEIIVQVAKDPIGTKGARLTCHVSLPGRYLVFMPTVDHIGVSRRIESESDRRRLKETISKIRPPKTGVIVRTASGKQTDRKLKADLDYLVTTWNDIQKKFNKQRTPSVVYQDLTIVLRAIRDMFTDEVDKVVVDSKREHRAIMKFVTRFIPNVKDKVELYSGDMPIFDAFGIETEITRSLERKVWLKSGGYLVVDQAEALVAIDVNTGRYVGKKTLEETILKTNLEAVKEIAYQLRLRNCGGIIILDLIDMEKEANKEKVYKALDEALKKDRARPSILKISQLGLIEMTRKRTRDSIVRSLCEPCSYCDGRSFVKNKLTIAYDIMRDIEREGVITDTQAISIQCHPSVADVLVEDKRDVLEDLEHQFNKKITIRGNGAYHVEQYELVAHRENKNLVWSSEERRKMLTQKIQERQQKMASEQRKVAETERADRKREQANERKQVQDKRKEERKLQQEERKLQLEERRRLAEERKQLALANGTELPPEEDLSLGLAPELGPDGLPLPNDLDDDLDYDSDEQTEGGLPQPNAQPGAAQPRNGDRAPRRRRRGRRGNRGRGRFRNPDGTPGVAPRLPGPNPQAGGTGPDQGNPTFAEPSAEHLGPRDLAGSAYDSGEEGDEGPMPGNGVPSVNPNAAGAPPALNPDGTPRKEGPRRGRRGRRGGRNRRFGRRPLGAGGPNAPAQAGGVPGAPPRLPTPNPTPSVQPISASDRKPDSGGGSDHE